MQTKNMKSLSTTSAFTLMFIMTSIFTNLAYAVKPVYSGGKARAAIRGYDPVAYFTDNKPVEGSKEHVYTHNGAKWLFSSQKNLDAFKANPDKYTPQYGGYCAYAVSTGSTASIKPQYFTIYNNKLYLNYSKSVSNKWLKKKDFYIEKADSKWPDLVD